MSKTLADRALALAGVFQATQLVHHYAHTGTIANEDLETAVKSLLKLDAHSTAEVFAGVEHLHTGLHALKEHLTGRVAKGDIPVFRYTVSLLNLENRLMKRRDMLDMLREGIQQARQQAGYFSLTHENVLASLADLYQRTISTLGSRIMVQGDPQLLTAAHHQHVIRVLLLSGTRSAVLWDQCGGSRWQLLFKRRSLIAAADSLLDTLEDG